MLPSLVPTTLLICTRCRPAPAAADASRPGAVLHEAACRAAASDARVRVAGIACLSGCRRACAAALLAPGKVGYLFGDVSPNADGVADLLAAARAHAMAPEGHLPRAQRPERLRASIIARLPPHHWLPEAPEGVIAWPA